MVSMPAAVRATSAGAAKSGGNARIGVMVITVLIPINAVLTKLPAGHYNTDLGYALRQFVRDHTGSVDHRTTVIVLGDGRNNYNDPALGAVDEIKRRSRRLIWMNPEYPAQWGTGDSDMDRYAPMCNDVHTVRNLKQLTDAIDSILG